MAKKNEISKAESASLQPLEDIENLIHVIRGKQVMLDRDIARLYGVETKRLNQQVQRNLERFPGDFMFQLNKEEAESSRSQFVMLNDGSDNLKSQFATSSEDESLVCAKFALPKKYGRRGGYLQEVETTIYNLDVIISVNCLTRPLANH